MISFKCFIINQGRQLRHNAPVPPGGREPLARPGPAAEPGQGGTGRREEGSGRAGRERERERSGSSTAPALSAVLLPALPSRRSRSPHGRAEPPREPLPARAVLDPAIWARCAFPRGARSTTAAPLLFSARDQFVRNQTAAPSALGPYLPRLIRLGNVKYRSGLYFCLRTSNFAKYLHLWGLKVR